MDLSDRIKAIIDENGINQRQFAKELSVSESYISAIIRKRNTVLSSALASLIEEKYGYSANWILHNIEPKIKQFSKNKTLTDAHQKALIKIEELSDAQVKATLAFIKFLEEQGEL